MNMIKRIGAAGMLVWFALAVPCAVCAQEADPPPESTQTVRESRIYVINPDGTGDYTTIQAGVDAAEDGDTLLIYPGVYEESVDATGKAVNLLGVSREACILTYAGNDYTSPPLSIGAGSVRNLTICNHQVAAIFESTDGDDPQLFTRFDSGYDYSGYAIHIEDDYLYGRSLEIGNCIIQSDHNYCVGMGGRGSSQILFHECELYANGSGGCIYLHDGVTADVIGETDIYFINCTMSNQYSPYFMVVHSISEFNTMYLTFQNVTVDTPVYEDYQVYEWGNMYRGTEPDWVRVPVYIWNYSGVPGDGWCGLSNVYLTEDSWGNTLRILNAE